jgi:hypothetical protein
MTIGFIDQAIVYTRDPAGQFTVVARSGLACRIAHLRLTGRTLEERGAQAKLRRFLYDPSYQLPRACQVEIAGERWNPVNDTDAAPRGPSGQVHHKSIDLLRAAS